MIKSAQEFVQLRTSTSQKDYLRAANDSAALEVWVEVVKTFPDLKVWVVHNKTVPVAILIDLASDNDPAVRRAVATKNKLPRDLMERLATDVRSAPHCS
jgi:hypothetical protein